MTRTKDLEALGRAERLQLLRFVISFAWADLAVSDAERAFVNQLVVRLRLDPDEARAVDRWLAVPPAPDDVDPAAVPHEHRRLFLDVVREMVSVDGEISAEERENLALLEQLTR